MGEREGAKVAAERTSFGSAESLDNIINGGARHGGVNGPFGTRDSFPCVGKKDVVDRSCRGEAEVDEDARAGAGGVSSWVCR